MSIFDEMRKLTSGKKLIEDKKQAENLKPQHGDTLNGVISSVVHKVNNKKGGYGFITSEQLPFERIFFHWTGLRQDTLRFPDVRKRMKVEFQLQYNEYDGYKAIKVKVLE